MGDDQEQHDRAELLRLWHEYGRTFNSFVPEEQPFTDKREPEVPGGAIMDDSAREH